MTPRCRAHNRAGAQCGLAPIHGATVCQVHGGRAPQVKAAAARRIADLYPKALVAIERAIDDPTPESRSSSVSAAKMVVEYHDGKPKERLEAVVLNAFTLRIDRGDDDST